MGTKQNGIQNIKRLAIFICIFLCKYFKIYIHVNAIS